MSAPPAIACVVVAAMLYDHGELLLDLSYEAGLEVQTTACGHDVPEPAPDAAYIEAYALLAIWEDEARCGGLDSDACLRDRLRAQLEALEAGRSYEEVLATTHRRRIVPNQPRPMATRTRQPRDRRPRRATASATHAPRSRHHVVVRPWCY